MATETVITLETLSKQIEAVRKECRKIRQHFEDPNGEKAAARAANNGFNKLMEVTPALRSFLGLAADEKISRSAVTKRINKYAEEKGLKSGQKLEPDAALKALLEAPEGEQLTFLNIQKYLNKHYIKEPKPEKPPKAEKPKEPKEPKAEKPKTEKSKEDRPKVAKKTAAA